METITRISQNDLYKRELPRIRNALAPHEKKLGFDKLKLETDALEAWAHTTKAPHGGWYVPTDIFELNSFLYQFIFKGKSVIDIGGGLGAPSLNFVHYFPRVAMMEADPEIKLSAETIKKSLGAPYDQAQYYYGDFIKLGRNLIRDFDLVYFYIPFADNFTNLMADFISCTKRGQTVLAHKLLDPEACQLIFPHDNFRRINNVDWFKAYQRI